MAITILSSPGTHTPAYNNQYFEASSTNSSQTNFKYVVTVGINDGVQGANTTLKIPARPDNKRLYFNPQRIAEAYVKSSFSTTALDFFYPDAGSNSSFKKVTVGIDEEYGSPVTGFGGVSSSYYIWNSSYDAVDFSNFTYATTTSAKDLTLSPSLKDYININQQYLYKTWHRGFSTRNIRYLNINAYDSAGALLQATVIENQFYSVGPAYSKNYITLNISPYGLNNYTGSFISGTPGAVIPATTSYYTMYFDDGAGPPQVSSNTYTVYINEFCSKYTRYVLHFLNKLGNYDSFTFNLLSRQTTDKDTDQYKKIPYENNASNQYRYEEYTNDTVVYNTVLTNKWKLNSDWITDAQSSWLRDLFMSPDIKLEIPDDTDMVGDQSALISVKVTPKTYETRKTVNDKAINITIEIENALQDVRQRA